MIQHFLADIEDRAVFRDGFLRHPLRNAVILGSETCAFVELAFHLDGLLAQFLQNIIGQVIPAITCLQQTFHHAIGSGGISKARKDARANRVVTSHVQLSIERYIPLLRSGQDD